MSSLQEQLLKAGLSTKQKARQANTEKRRKAKKKRSGLQVEASLQEQIKQDVALSAQQKAEKDKALNEQKAKALADKELALRIEQILKHHCIKNVEGEQVYNYTQDNKVKKLFVDEKTYQALVNGRLALCGLAGESYLVTSETADKLAQLDEKVVLVLNTNAQEQLDEDDPYAEYQIPDDLMW
jgi:uncharacterized protein YaiL (DUF2058 family)